VAAQSAEASAITTGKLNQIHELVNSALTAQMEDAHDALTQQLVLMREVIALHTAAGRTPSPCAVPKLAAQALSWHFSTKDMIGLRADPPAIPDPGRSVAGEDRHLTALHDQDGSGSRYSAAR
jgi:hypothetical protein